MDKKDQKILAELDRDCLMTTSALGKKLRISQQVADYRLKKLQEKGVIKKFGTIVDLYKLDIQQYRVFLRFKGIDSKLKKQIFTYLKSHPQVYWAARIGGRFDLLIVVGVQDFPTFDKFMDKLYKQFPKCFSDYRANYVLKHELFKHKHWNSLAQDHYLSYGTGVTVEKLDDMEWKILELLKDNARLSSLQIAQQCDTSYKTIQQRIKGLRKKGVILGERLFISDKENDRFIVLLSYNEFSKTKENKLFAECRAHPAVTQTVYMFGGWPVFLHVRVKDHEELQQFINELREKHPMIQDHEAIPIFEDILINLLPKEK